MGHYYCNCSSHLLSTLTLCYPINDSIFVMRWLENTPGVDDLLDVYYVLVHARALFLPVWGSGNGGTRYLVRLQKWGKRLVFSLSKHQFCKDYFSKSRILTVSAKQHQYSLPDSHNRPGPIHSTSFIK